MMCETPDSACTDRRAPLMVRIDERSIPMISNHLDETFEEKDKVYIYNSLFTLTEDEEQLIADTLDNYWFVTGFYLLDLESGMAMGCNADYDFQTASTVKAGYALYCFKQIAAGKASFDDRLEYKRKHYIKGSGSTQYSSFGTLFTVKALLYRLIYNSDNVAYYMLLDYFGTEGYNDMMHELGNRHEITPEERWGYLTPHELGMIWQEIYRFKDECSEGALLWEYLTTNLYNELAEELTEYDVIAHKSGWSDYGYHDSGIICGDHDYIMIIMTDTGRKTTALYRTARVLDSIMRRYYLYYYG